MNLFDDDTLTFVLPQDSDVRIEYTQMSYRQFRQYAKAYRKIVREEQRHEERMQMAALGQGAAPKDKDFLADVDALKMSIVVKHTRDIRGVTVTIDGEVTPLIWSDDFLKTIGKTKEDVLLSLGKSQNQCDENFGKLFELIQNEMTEEEKKASEQPSDESTKADQPDKADDEPKSNSPDE